MVVRLTRARTVALVAAVLVCAIAAWIWREPMAPVRAGMALQGWWIGLWEQRLVVGDHRWVYDERDANDVRQRCIREESEQVYTVVQAGQRWQVEAVQLVSVNRSGC